MVTSFVFVVVPERLPILETHRAMSVLCASGIPVGGLIVNQVRAHAGEGDGDAIASEPTSRQADYLAEIESRFGNWPIWYVPRLTVEPVGVEGLEGLRPLSRWIPGKGR